MSEIKEFTATDLEVSEFDAAEYLKDEETITAYLNALLEEGGTELFLEGIKDVAKARGMSQLAKDTGLGRESLYKSLSKGKQPRYETVSKILNGLGVRLQVQPCGSKGCSI
ncbi:MAG: putative addiction module antidote protein [Desulfovibrionales bacterium]|nr:putative addiction module antidote protein [Desulfovibrionales bacterium]